MTLADAIERANHWTQLAWGEAWAAVARVLEPERPAAARAAWRRAADGYEAYADAYARNLPASRWDYDYGREGVEARALADELAPVTDRGAPSAAWIEDTLDGRFDDALDGAPDDAEPIALDELSRAVARVLAVACAAAGRDADTTRFSALAAAGEPR